MAKIWPKQVQPVRLLQTESSGPIPCGVKHRSVPSSVPPYTVVDLGLAERVSSSLNRWIGQRVAGSSRIRPIGLIASGAIGSHDIHQMRIFCACVPYTRSSESGGLFRAAQRTVLNCIRPIRSRAMGSGRDSDATPNPAFWVPRVRFPLVQCKMTQKFSIKIKFDPVNFRM